MKKFACFLQLLLLNLAGVYFLSVAWMNGWIQKAYGADPTMISSLIGVLFIFAVCLLLFRAWEVDKLLQSPYLDPSLTSKPESSLQAWFRNKIRFITNASYNCVVLGLIGTVVGFIIALDGISLSMFQSIEGMRELSGQLIVGASVAFYTTVVGFIASGWLEVQINLYSKYASNLYQRIVDDA